MSKKLGIYKCNVCKQIAEVALSGDGDLVCCGEEMEFMEGHKVEESDAHYAHIENIDEITKKITFNHEMTEVHHIEFIEVISKDEKYVKRKYLEHNETPEMLLKFLNGECKSGYFVRLYCNRDGVKITEIH